MSEDGIKLNNRECKIGILMLDSRFPRIKGDIGNEKTFSYPVKYKVVKGMLPKKVVLDLTKDDVKPFIDAAKELEKDGVLAITTSCGFLALFQEEISKKVNIPVYTSSLIQLPMISKMIGEGKKVLIVTANYETLSRNHIKSVCGNIKKRKYDIVGTQGKMMTEFTVQNWDEVDTEQCKKDIEEVIDEQMKTGSQYGAILFECTNMPPYSDYIRNKYGIPVFDIVTLTNYIYESI